MNLSKTIKDDLLPKLRERYACRQRVGKTRMLDALCENYGYDRKSVSKLLGDACRRCAPKWIGPSRRFSTTSDNVE